MPDDKNDRAGAVEHFIGRFGKKVKGETLERLFGSRSPFFKIGGFNPFDDSFLDGNRFLESAVNGVVEKSEGDPRGMRLIDVAIGNRAGGIDNNPRALRTFGLFSIGAVK